MKKIKFSGRETAVLRTIDFSTGTAGSEILERTHLEAEELLDIINGLMESGYVETSPISERVEICEVFETIFEINPAYVHDLREAIVRR